MVFLADDTYPYSIFYCNEAFEEKIGESLKDRNLVGLGLDINAYIFKEELVLSASPIAFAAGSPIIFPLRLISCKEVLIFNASAIAIAPSAFISLS